MRAGNKIGSHCDSCHEDHAHGYADYDESYRHDDEFKDGRKAYERRGGKPPWALQFCCCSEAELFDDEIKRWLKDHEVVNA